MFRTVTRAAPRPFAIASAVVLAAATLSACSGTSADGDTAKVDVVAGFYPLKFAAEQIGGDRVAVNTLTPPGVEPHDLELTPQQVADLQDADLVLVLQGFQPAVDDAIADLPATKVLDLSVDLATLEGEAHTDEDGGQHSDEEAADGGAKDPHIWLDPTLMATMAERIQTRLSDIDAPGAAAYAAQAKALDSDLVELDKDWKADTATCESRDLVVSHEAFAYLGARYDFTQVGLSGLSPEAEPTPKRLAEVADFVRENDVTTIYFETLVDPKVAETIAKEADVTTAPLDPIEGLADGSDDDYISIMRTNLEQIVDGQRCA